MLKKWTKAEDATTAASQKKRRRTLLQTYLVSLMSLCLSVSMLLGTTMAWFTSTVDVPQNEIYVGTLDVDLQLMSAVMTAEEEPQLQGTSLKADENGSQTKVFGDDIIWQAGLVQVRTFKIIDNGEIPFSYCLSLTPSQDKGLVTLREPDTAQGQTEIENELEFLKCFEVYAKTGDAVGFQNGDLFNASEWIKVGTLDELVSEEFIKAQRIAKTISFFILQFLLQSCILILNLRFFLFETSAYYLYPKAN